MDFFDESLQGHNLLHLSENEHDHGQTNHLKIYLLLKIVIFHCHVGLREGLVRIPGQIRMHLPWVN